MICPHGIHMDNACGACVPPRGTTVRGWYSPVDEKLRTALAAPGVERLRDFYNVGPVQRAAVESFADALAAGVTEDAALNVDELAEVIRALNEAGHGKRDFESECPACTARRKLEAMRDAALTSPTSKTAEPAEATNMEKKNAE